MDFRVIRKVILRRMGKCGHCSLQGSGHRQGPGHVNTLMNDFHTIPGIARLDEQLPTSREAPYCIQFTVSKLSCAIVLS